MCVCTIGPERGVKEVKERERGGKSKKKKRDAEGCSLTKLPASTSSPIGICHGPRISTLDKYIYRIYIGYIQQNKYIKFLPHYNTY